MSVVQNTLIGRARNKIGGTVFSTWKGKNVLKSKPLTVANPKTNAQQAQRSKMTQLVNYFRFALSLIRYSFIEVSAGSTEWASFMKYNLKNAFTVSGATATLDPEALIFARGTLVNPSDMAAASLTTAGCNITWTDDSGAPGTSDSDVLLCCAVMADGEARFAGGTATRADEAFVFTFASALPSTSYEVYAWWVNISGRKASDSVLLTA